VRQAVVVPGGRVDGGAEAGERAPRAGAVPRRPRAGADADDGVGDVRHEVRRGGVAGGEQRRRGRRAAGGEGGHEQRRVGDDGGGQHGTRG
jgi:hypothetical protein